MDRIRYTGVAVCFLGLALLAGCQGSGIAEREGYFSWVDEQGRVRYSRIPDSQGQSDGGLPSGAEGIADAGDDNTESASRPEAERGAAAKLQEDLEYTTENYPDGEALAKKGFIRPGQRQPYFTWRDADGIVRVSYYTPDMRTEEQKTGDKPPVVLSDARVYLPGSVADHKPVPGHDPDAFAILGIEAPENFFPEFSKTCCQALPAREFQQWQEGREFGVRFDDNSPSYNFSTGESPYRLIALPSSTFVPGFVMRLRSYAHNGVLIPSLAFLDKNLRPVRIVTDLVLDYEPENWRRRGYLEGWIPAFPGQGERWLVIFTRPEDLAEQTVIQAESMPKAIPHTPVGELGITTFEE
ncbi:MalM family protein [Marinobacter sp. VGCF2001]|uniref:MalM family protein n=1 Tax=Marinobacter sp. VGCF2001 TaxID=3417189 RepID=UPI003CF3F009